ncbi:MAG: type II secretion system protein [Phycisphaerae bacterium]
MFKKVKKENDDGWLRVYGIFSFMKGRSLTYRPAGFTLIELLVVVAIIAILVSILLPALASARSSARQVTCLSSIKQISLAFTQYTDDHQGRFPFAVTEREANDSARWGTIADTALARAPFSFRAQLDRYIPNVNSGSTSATNIFKCPESTVPWPAPGAGKWYTTDYGFNLSEAKYSIPAASGFTVTLIQWYRDNPDYGFNEDYTVSSLANPSGFIITADAARSDGTPSRGGLYPLQAIDPSNSGQARILERHRDVTANVGYADGHSEYTTFQKSWARNQWKRNP